MVALTINRDADAPRALSAVLRMAPGSWSVEVATPVGAATFAVRWRARRAAGHRGCAGGLRLERRRGRWSPVHSPSETSAGVAA